MSDTQALASPVVAPVCTCNDISDMPPKSPPRTVKLVDPDAAAFTRVPLDTEGALNENAIVIDATRGSNVMLTRRPVDHPPTDLTRVVESDTHTELSQSDPPNDSAIVGPPSLDPAPVSVTDTAPVVPPFIRNAVLNLGPSYVNAWLTVDSRSPANTVTPIAADTAVPLLSLHVIVDSARQRDDCDKDPPTRTIGVPFDDPNPDPTTVKLVAALDGALLTTCTDSDGESKLRLFERLYPRSAPIVPTARLFNEDPRCNERHAITVVDTQVVAKQALPPIRRPLDAPRWPIAWPITDTLIAPVTGVLWLDDTSNARSVENASLIVPSQTGDPDVTVRRRLASCTPAGTLHRTVDCDRHSRATTAVAPNRRAMLESQAPKPAPTTVDVSMPVAGKLLRTTLLTELTSNVATHVIVPL